MHANVSTQYCPAVNLDRLWTLVSEQTRKKYEKNSKKAPVIDVSRAGYFKVSDPSKMKGGHHFLLCCVLDSLDCSANETRCDAHLI